LISTPEHSHLILKIRPMPADAHQKPMEMFSPTRRRDAWHKQSSGLELSRSEPYQRADRKYTRGGVAMSASRNRWNIMGRDGVASGESSRAETG
jgi:hypothetical protein